MKKVKVGVPLILLLVALAFFISHKWSTRLSITYPYPKTVFPPEFPAPSFIWKDKSGYSGLYAVSLRDKNNRFSFDTLTGNESWIPSEIEWENLKQLSAQDDIRFSVKRKGKSGKSVLAFCFSADSVAAPILYRQMPIPFVVAEKKLDSMNYMLINTGSIKPPHAVMKGFSVCGNCHSFTKNGGYIGLDLDAGRRDKGGYFIAPVRDSIEFNIDNYMSWTRLEKRKTFGLFSKISPDGKWIIFCKSANFMLLQPDSRLYIVPVEGGRAKELSCNLPLMNSWHAWSPNSKWIVFVSKGLSIYTDMFLSHINESGHASPPVLLEKARQFQRVANYPEFINTRPDKVFDMNYDYTEMAHIERALEKGNIGEAKLLYIRFKNQDPLLFREDYYIILQFLKRMGLDAEIDSLYKKKIFTVIN